MKLKDDVRELYQQTILDHNKNPQNFRKLEVFNRYSEGYNPFCGDHFHVYMMINDDTIKDITFQGAGCAISKASASLMSLILKNKRIIEVEEIFNMFHNMITIDDIENNIEKLGKLIVFNGIHEYPSRVKCAILIWHTMNNALKNENKFTLIE